MQMQLMELFSLKSGQPVETWTGKKSLYSKPQSVLEIQLHTVYVQPSHHALHV